MTEICGGMVVEVLVQYLKIDWSLHTVGARDPPHHAVVRSPRVTTILDVFKTVDPGRTLRRTH